jgi:hypothetical protein
VYTSGCAVDPGRANKEKKMAVSSTSVSDRTGGGRLVFVADHVDELRDVLAKTVLSIDPYQSPSASTISVSDDGKFVAHVTYFGLGD